MELQTELGEDKTFTVGNDGRVKRGVTSPTSDRFGGSWMDTFLVRLPYRREKARKHSLIQSSFVCFVHVCVFVCALEDLQVWLC